MRPDNRYPLSSSKQLEPAVLAEPSSALPAKFVWEKTEALERLDGDEELLKELCQIFLQEYPALLQKLRKAISESDAESVQRTAHSLKGEVSYLGAPDATKTAKSLEDMGRERKLSQALKAFTVLERELVELQQVIQDSNGANR